MRALRLGAATVSIAIGIGAGAALADAPPPSYPPGYTPPEYAPKLTYDWTGIYMGGQIGAAYSQTEWTFGVPASLVLPDRLEHIHTGFTGGAHVGLQKQWSWIVLGAEVSYLWMDQPESTGSASVLFPGTTLTSNVHNLMLVTGKFGWAWENLLASFKGGWASGDVDFRTPLVGGGTVQTSNRENGWTAGASIEYAVWDHVILGVAYDYVELNPGGRIQSVGPPVTRVDAGVDIQTVTARLTFKWGGTRYEALPAK